MDLVHRIDLARRWGGLSGRIRSISSRLSGVALLVCAIGLAIWARDLTRADLLADWEHHHGPGTAVWKHALGARGLVALTGMRELHLARRTLPETVDEQAWMAWDGMTVAVSAGNDLYCRGCGGGRIPSHWEPLGEGWKGFESTLEALDRRPAPPSAPSGPKKARYQADPLEIRY